MGQPDPVFNETYQILNARHPYVVGRPLPLQRSRTPHRVSRTTSDNPVSGHAVTSGSVCPSLFCIDANFCRLFLGRCAPRFLVLLGQKSLGAANRMIAVVSRPPANVHSPGGSICAQRDGYYRLQISVNVPSRRDQGKSSDTLSFGSPHPYEPRSGQPQRRSHRDGPIKGRRRGHSDSTVPAPGK